MSNPDVRKSLKQFIAGKIQSRDEQLKSTTDLEEQRYVLADFELFFKGAAEAMQAIMHGANLDENDQAAVVLAQQSNKIELQSLEQRIKLQDLLNSDDDSEA